MMCILLLIQEGADGVTLDSESVFASSCFKGRFGDHTIFFQDLESLRLVLYRKSSLCDGGTFWTLVFLQGPGQESRYSFVRNDVAAVYQG